MSKNCELLEFFLCQKDIKSAKIYLTGTKFELDLSIFMTHLYAEFHENVHV